MLQRPRSLKESVSRWRFEKGSWRGLITSSTALIKLFPLALKNPISLLTACTSEGTYAVVAASIRGNICLV
ncbi:MAG: hypothetical protein R6V50_07820 [Thermoplasmatota archaeon]